MATLNFRHLRYFWAVAHDGNLTRAATRLHVSQSALSVQIQKLEQQLGQQLFERRGRSLMLTEAGRIALDHADAIFASGDELVATLSMAGAQRGVFRVGALATLSRNFQASFLRPLLGRDDVELVLRSGPMRELLEALEAHRLDIVLANIAPPRDAATPWLVYAIDEQPVSLVGAPADDRRAESLADLLMGEPLILPSLESSIRIGFDALADRLGAHPRIAAEVDDMAMLRVLAKERVGLAVVPPIVVKDELESGLLQEVSQLPGLAEGFFAITPRRRFPNPLLREVLTTEAARGAAS